MSSKRAVNPDTPKILTPGTVGVKGAKTIPPNVNFVVRPHASKRTRPSEPK